MCLHPLLVNTPRQLRGGHQGQRGPHCAAAARVAHAGEGAVCCGFQLWLQVADDTRRRRLVQAPVCSVRRQLLHSPMLAGPNAPLKPPQPALRWPGDRPEQQDWLRQGGRHRQEGAQGGEFWLPAMLLSGWWDVAVGWLADALRSLCCQGNYGSTALPSLAWLQGSTLKQAALALGHCTEAGERCACGQAWLQCEALHAAGPLVSCHCCSHPMHGAHALCSHP